MRMLFVAGAVLAALAVGTGAFGAHALTARLAPERLITWETAARYHMYGSLGVLLLALAGERWTTGLMHLAGWTLVGGVLVFGGTVYLLALGGPRWLGAVTPLGGLAMIAAWVMAALAALRAP